MRVLTYCIALFGISLLLSSCFGPSIEGTWEVKSSRESPLALDTTLTFSNPETAKGKIEIFALDPKLGTDRVTANVAGTWNLKDGYFVFESSAVTWEVNSGLVLPKLVQDRIGGDLKDFMRQNLSGKHMWIGNDKFVITHPDDSTTTFTRRKG